MHPYNVKKIREDFPALHQVVNGQPLIYLDNAATTQKPQIVIDTISTYYSTFNSNVHRGVHHLSQVATDAFENTREHIRKYINAPFADEIIITKGATDSINLVAYSFGKGFIDKGDEVIISAYEHHANIVPWQMICEEKGAILKIIPFKKNGTIPIDEYKSLISEKTKIVSVVTFRNWIVIFIVFQAIKCMAQWV
jgi:cysteine desulfurase/selenocysteine lyase